MKCLIPLTFLLFTNYVYGLKTPQFKDGDIIFQISLSAQSKVIEAATKSQWTHTGVIFYIKGKPYVYEAINSVTFTPLDKWISRGKGKKYVVKRLKDRDRYLTELTLSVMKRKAKEYKDKKYDYYFDWSDSQMYCSELVWKLYYESLGIRLCTLQKLQDFDLSAKIVRQKIQARYGKHIPYNEPVVSPIAIFQSDLLTTVYQK